MPFWERVSRLVREIIAKSLASYGATPVRLAKRDILRFLTAEDLDELADDILSKASNPFMDKVLAHRLETISGQDLVNALARAERLGYDLRDVAEGGGPGSASEHAITKSNPNIVYCVSCHRPCSSYEALLHHSRKAGCQGNAHYQYLSKESCLHCGCQFASAAGRIYHEKFKVCGNYPPEIDNIMSDLLAKLIRTHQSTPSFATPHKTTPVLLPSHVSQYQTPASKAASVVPSQTQTPAQTGTPAGTYHHGPYAHLTPEQRKAFEEEMKASEAFYGDLMKKAMELPAAQQEEELSKIKNRFNTKQSTTRKRYGIRLREKRTQAEIEAERRRLLGDDAPETEIQALKKARVSGDGQAAVTQSAPDPARIHETPRKRVPLTEMGGLAGSQATAEMVDPTGYLLPSNARPVHIRGAAPGANRGTSDDPMQIDDDSEAGNDEDSEEDIPARPPAPQSAQAAGI
ncbi:hypothetical protein ESCO_004738 [Escovopsis weberi]|uniref:Uncharacterized protein n=1 Tax=Escovopsis weberi TaxID=150374 RepID=A0A0M8MPT8_ESCWE|nr:hypothetical protein ESCO_004738 [Escovopsis weberi]